MRATQTYSNWEILLVDGQTDPVTAVRKLRANTKCNCLTRFITWSIPNMAIVG